MEYTTKTQELGEVTFIAPGAASDYAGYVYIEFPNGNRKQICYGGDFKGDTVAACAGSVKTAAQKWMRQRREWLARA